MHLKGIGSRWFVEAIIRIWIEPYQPVRCLEPVLLAGDGDHDLQSQYADRVAAHDLWLA